jgi:hypothetical protein
MEKSYLDFYPDIIIDGLKPRIYDVSHIDVSQRQEKVIIMALYESKENGQRFAGIFTFFHLKPKLVSQSTPFNGLGCFAMTKSITLLPNE